MPLYEFDCPACDAEFTELFPRYDPDALADVACPECGRREAVRRLSTFAANTRRAGSVSGAGAASCAPAG